MLGGARTDTDRVAWGRPGIDARARTHDRPALAPHRRLGELVGHTRKMCDGDVHTKQQVVPVLERIGLGHGKTNSHRRCTFTH